MSLSDLLNDFLFEKELAGLSPASITAYRDMLQIFVNFAGADLKIELISDALVKQYIKNLMKRGLAKATLASYIRNLRIFLKWVSIEYGLSFDPTKIKVPKAPRRMVRILSDSEIERLFNSVGGSMPWIVARNRAMIALMLDSGVRQAEVCGLLKCNIDLERMILKVTGKGAKDRLVPLGDVSLMYLKEYLSVCPFKDSPCVFLGRLGEPITTNAVKVFMNRLKHQTGFDLSSHKLRHNFATNFCIDNLHDTGSSHVYDLSILLGHESIETTKIYEHFAHSMIAAEFRNSHLDRVMKK